MPVYHPPMPASASETKALFEELKTEIRQTKKEISQLLSEMKKDSAIIGSNYLYVDDKSKRFSSIFGSGKDSQLLKPYVERYNTTFNVYWKKIDEAAEYTVEVYKYISNEWYKLSDIFVSRTETYLAITNLVGDGYVFRVIARDRNGIEIAKSEGTVIGSKTAE